MKKIIPYGRHWVGKEEVKAVLKTLHSDWLVTGPTLKKFEKAFADFVGVKYAVAVSSGTAALHTACWAAGIGKGDEIITTPLTFVATAQAPCYLGAKPVLVDIDPKTYNLDPEKIKEKIIKKTRAIIPVDYAGQPADYERILKIAKENSLLVIEDACHAVGSKYKGKKVGSLADLTCFSFHPVKNMTACWGGMVTTNNKNFYEKMRIFRNNGIVRGKNWHYQVKHLGFNYFMTDLQAAIGLAQLKKLPSFIEKRRKIVEIYNKAFVNIEEITIPYEDKNNFSAWHLYVILLNLEKLKVKREVIFKKLRRACIGVQVHYIPIHYHPYFAKNFGFQKGAFPIVEDFYQRCLTFPLFPKMTLQQTEYIIGTTKEILQNNRK